MAGDWIKWQRGLTRKPEVIRMAAALGRSRHEVAGLLMQVWEWTDEQIADPDENGHAFVRILSGQARALIDEIAGLPGFADAMSAEGWITFRSAHVEFPNWGRHNGNSAKRRCLDAERKRRERSENVRKMSGSEPDKKRTREEKRRENSKSGVPDLDNALPQSLDCDSFRSAWADWLAYRQSLKPALKPQSIHQQLDRLAEHGPDVACATIRASIANGWKGLFPESTQPRKGRTHANGPGQLFAGVDALGEV